MSTKSEGWYGAGRAGARVGDLRRSNWLWSQWAEGIRTGPGASCLGVRDWLEPVAAGAELVVGVRTLDANLPRGKFGRERGGGPAKQ